MLKLVVNDYRMEFKHMVKRKNRSGFEWLSMYGIICLCLSSLGGNVPIRSEQFVWSAFFLLIVWGCVFLGDLYPNTVGKMFYLLPVSEEDRRKYIWTGYWFRVFFLMAVLLVVLLSGIFFVNLEVWRAGEMMFHFFLMMCIRNTYTIADYTMVTEKLGYSCGRKKSERCLYYLALSGNLASILLIYFSMVDWLSDCVWQISNHVVIEGDSLIYNKTFCAVLCIMEVLLTGVVCFIFWHNVRGGYSEDCN